MVGPLEEKLGGPLLEDARLAIVNRLWETSYNSKLLAYFGYYEDQCRHANTTSSCHSEVLDIVDWFKTGTEERGGIEQKLLSINNLRATGIDNEQVQASIALAVRIWLMMNVGKIGSALNPGQTQASWTEGTIYSLVEKTFPPDHELDSHVKLEKIFNARNLQTISGIRVSWTDNIVDHLSMRDDDTRVLIFHHVSFLQLHRDCGRSPYTLDFLDETLRTLSLLLPPNDKKTSQWFKQKQKQFNLDPQAGRCSHLNAASRQIENFKYWRDRIVVLKQAFDESEPKTMTQWWNDDRKRVQWYTFWIAVLVLVLTVFFGLVESISGVVQAWASVKSLNSG